MLNQQNLAVSSLPSLQTNRKILSSLKSNVSFLSHFVQHLASQGLLLWARPCMYIALGTGTWCFQKPLLWKEMPGGQVGVTAIKASRFGEQLVLCTNWHPQLQKTFEQTQENTIAQIPCYDVIFSVKSTLKSYNLSQTGRRNFDPLRMW